MGKKRKVECKVEKDVSPAKVKLSPAPKKKKNVKNGGGDSDSESGKWCGGTGGGKKLETPTSHCGKLFWLWVHYADNSNFVNNPKYQSSVTYFYHTKQTLPFIVKLSLSFIPFFFQDESSVQALIEQCIQVI